MVKRSCFAFLLGSLVAGPVAHAFMPDTSGLQTTHSLVPPARLAKRLAPAFVATSNLSQDDAGTMTFLGKRKLDKPRFIPESVDVTTAMVMHFVKTVTGDASLRFMQLPKIDDGENALFGLVQAVGNPPVGEGARGVVAPGMDQRVEQVPILGTFALAQVEGEDMVRYVRHHVVEAPRLSIQPHLNPRDASSGARNDALSFAQSATEVKPAPLLAVQYIDEVPTLIWMVHIATEAPWGTWAYSIDAHSGAVASRVKASLDGVSGVVRANVEPMCQGDVPRPTPLSFIQWTTGRATNGHGEFRSAQNLSRAQVLFRGAYFRVDSYPGDNAVGAYPLQAEPASNEVFFDRAPLSQADPYVYANTARDWLMARAATVPEIAARRALRSWTGGQFPIKVNLPSGYQRFSCNAFYDGMALNFYQADARMGCNNSGRAAKIVYHEYGHGVHDHLTANRYTFNPQVSEGIADYVMGTITNDPNVTGLLGCTDPLPGRNTIRTCVNQYTYCNSRRCTSYPGDEAHNAAPIMCGALWEVRQAMRQKYGAEQGTLKADQFFLRFLTVVTDMNSAYGAAIAADEDTDNDPSNGTTNSCIINNAFIGRYDGDFAHFPNAVRQRVPCL